MEKLFKCFSFKVMQYLVSKNFIPCGQRTDLKDDSRQIWLFKNSNELQEEFHNYQNIKNK